jgi:hypothetical protein
MLSVLHYQHIPILELDSKFITLGFQAMHCVTMKRGQMNYKDTEP